METTEELQNQNPEAETSEQNQEDSSSNIQIEAELAEWKDKFLRLASEFENYKKRTTKEKSDLVNFANEQVLVQILPVLDDFDRTLKVLDSSDNMEAIKKGIEMVSKNLQRALQKSGLEQVDCHLQEFDADIHEAIGSLPVENPEHKNKIIEVLEPGYKLNGKIIRYAKVLTGV